MFKFKTGDIFTTQCSTITIPVNLEGVAGAGLALEFKKRYPDFYKGYKNFCSNKNTIWPVLFVSSGLVDKKILLFATKYHWKEDSSKTLIEKQLKLLNECNLPIVDWYGSLAIPKLGCGCGKLNWEDEVKPLVLSYLKDLAEKIDIEIWE